MTLGRATVFNSQGFRGRELQTPKPTGELRVFTIGDSNTLGSAGASGPNWPARLEAKLVGLHDRTVVSNAGVWGYTTFQVVTRLRHMLVYEPDFVLISFGSNDAHRVRLSDREFAAGALRRSLWLRPVQWTRAGRLLLGTLDRRAMRRQRPLRPRVSTQEYRDNLVEMVRMARGGDAEIMFLTRPYIGVARDAEWWKNFAADYHAATLAVADALDVPVIDIYSHFKRLNRLFSDESHFNEAGHEHAADLILERLRPAVVQLLRAPGAGGR